jgi:hypothetical protein
MNKSAHRAVRPALRLVGFGAGLALLLSACGESTPEGEQQQQQQGSVSPPAAHQLASVQAISPSS